MKKQKFVLRKTYFGYNDEYYYHCGSRLDAILDNREEAEARFSSAQVDYLRETDLSEEASFFDADEEFLKQVDEFVFDRTKVHIAEDGHVEGGARLPEGLSDEDVLLFGRMARIQAYRLVAFDEDDCFFVLWDPKEQAYQQDFDECFTGLVYTSSRDEAVEGNLEALMEEKGWDSSVKVKGTLEGITESPVLLSRLIDTEKNFSYDEGKSVLKIRRPKPKQLAALNELLKKPLFEIRTHTPEEIVELEADMGEEY